MHLFDVSGFFCRKATNRQNKGGILTAIATFAIFCQELSHSDTQPLVYPYRLFHIPSGLLGCSLNLPTFFLPSSYLLSTFFLPTILYLPKEYFHYKLFLMRLRALENFDDRISHKNPSSQFFSLNFDDGFSAFSSRRNQISKSRHER